MDEGHRITARVNVAGTMDELQTAIRNELGADRIPLESRPGTAVPGTKADRDVWDIPLRRHGPPNTAPPDPPGG